MADPRKPSADEAAARAYLVTPRQEALQAHPKLAVAYTAEDRLMDAAREAKPLTPAVQLKVENTIRSSVASAVSRGQEPQAGDKAISAVRLQVAIDSAEHAVGQRRLNPDSKLNISTEHRELLVKHAEQTVRTAPDPARPGLSESQALRAREIAGNVGLLDMPRTENPFKHQDLKAAYDTQQAELRERSKVVQLTQAKGRGGMER